MNGCAVVVQETLLAPAELMEVLSVLWDRFEEVCVKHNVQRLSPHLTPCRQKSFKSFKLLHLCEQDRDGWGAVRVRVGTLF